MKTVAVVSQKGGAGKTTLVLHRAAAWAHADNNAAVTDLDPQTSAAKWTDRRTTELPIVLSTHASRLNPEMERVCNTGGVVHGTEQ